MGLAAILMGCPPPPIGHLYNNTDARVRYCSGWRCTNVAPGRNAEVRFRYAGSFRFSLRTPDGSFSYAIADSFRPAYEDRWPDSNCPGCPRYQFQLEPDMRVFLLAPRTDPPAASLPPQPPGFPLLPAEPAA